MAGLAFRVEWEGLGAMQDKLGELGKSERFESAMKKLAKDTEEAWQNATPKGKTGRLRGGDSAQVSGLSFTLNNAVYYYLFVDEGHWTPRGWRRKRHGRIVYVPAKKRSRVEGREMTKKAIDFAAENILEYLAKSLED